MLLEAILFCQIYGQTQKTIIVLSSLEIHNPQHLKVSNIETEVATLSDEFRNVLSDYKLRDIQIYNSNLIAAKISRTPNLITYSYNDISTNTQRPKSNYILNGQIVVYETGTIVFTAQIVDTRNDKTISSITSGYKRIRRTSELVVIIEENTYDLIQDIRKKINIIS